MPDSVADRPLATRESLQETAARLEQEHRGSNQMLLARIRARMENGDFRPGDRLLVEVEGESTLTDTFTVTAPQTLHLPPPTVGNLSLQGVLRTELESKVSEYVGRFVQDPVVRARPLIRLSIQGEVVKAGYYGVPADAVLADALMAAGGTTQRANLKKLKIERDGETFLEGEPLQEAVASGRTLDEARLRDGDQIVVAKGRDAGFEGNLRFLWVVVSLAGGIYGLSRAF